MARQKLRLTISLVKYIFISFVILGIASVSLLYDKDFTHFRDKRQTNVAHNQGLDVYRRDKVTFDDIITNNRTFNISGNDLLVLLHIQKTAGTAFENHLVLDLKIDRPCACSDDRRRCNCSRPNQRFKPLSVVDSTWLISRFSIGWACGLHSDWTQLTLCLRGLRNLFFATYLRHPLNRFISEFRHVQRGATWKKSKNYCESYNTQLCLGNRSTWLNVSLDEFMRCPNNMAINRQTRMLADHRTESCIERNLGNESRSAKDIAMLDSAIGNLRQTSFFGICEKQKLSQIVFEKTFNLTFDVEFKQSDDHRTKSMIDSLPIETKNKILELNHLDVKLYNYANDLINSRCNRLEDCWTHLEEEQSRKIN